MSLAPILWAMKTAPVIDSLERIVLNYIAESADEDGRNCFQSHKSIGEMAMVDPQTVRKKVQAMAARGILKPGDPTNSELLRIPKHLRPKNYDMAIPAGWWSPDDLADLNRRRERRGLQPFVATPCPGSCADGLCFHRPELPKPEQTGRKKRKDAKAAATEVESGAAESGSNVPPESGDPGDLTQVQTSGGMSQTPPMSYTPPVSQTPPMSQSGEGVSSSTPRGYLVDTQTSPINHPKNLPTSEGTEAGPDQPPLVEDATPDGAASEKPTSSKATAKDKRGSRIPEPFDVTPEMVAWAKTRCPLVNGRTETEKFVNHWVAIPGARGVKLDWPATWRKWFLTAQQQAEESLARQRNRQGTAYRSDDVWGAAPTTDDAPVIPGMDVDDDRWWELATPPDDAGQDTA